MNTTPQIIHKASWHWMINFNHVSPVIFSSLSYKKPENIIDDEDNFHNHMTNEQRNALKQAIKPYLSTIYLNSEIYDKLKGNSLIRKSNGMDFSSQAINHYINSARKEFGIPKPEKPATKTTRAIELIKSGVKRREIVKILKMNPKHLDKVRASARRNEILEKIA